MGRRPRRQSHSAYVSVGFGALRWPSSLVPTLHALTVVTMAVDIHTSIRRHSVRICHARARANYELGKCWTSLARRRSSNFRASLRRRRRSTIISRGYVTCTSHGSYLRKPTSYELRGITSYAKHELRGIDIRVTSYDPFGVQRLQKWPLRRHRDGFVRRRLVPKPSRAPSGDLGRETFERS